MKKIYICFLSCIAFFMLAGSTFAADCELMQNRIQEGADGQDEIIAEFSGGNIADMVENCLDDSGVYISKGGAEVTGGLRSTIMGWTQTIAVILGLLSVFGIVLGALRFALSGGNDEHINKGKSIIKWSILGLLGVMFAGTIIVVLVNIFYSI